MWYYNQNGQQFGPVHQSDFENMLRSGMISPQTPVWKDGMADWTAAGQVPELSGFFRAPSGPPQTPGYYSNAQQSPQNATDHSVSALVMGIVSVVLWIPLISVPLGICGIVAGSKSLNSAGHGKAMAGMILSIIGLIVNVLVFLVCIAEYADM